MYDRCRKDFLVDNCWFKGTELDGGSGWRHSRFWCPWRWVEYCSGWSEDAWASRRRIEIARFKSRDWHISQKVGWKRNAPLGSSWWDRAFWWRVAKVALARAFARRDEFLYSRWTSCRLDPRSEYRNLPTLYWVGSGKTTLLVAHRLASVRMANRILVMKKRLFSWNRNPRRTFGAVVSTLYRHTERSITEVELISIIILNVTIS